MIKQMFLSLVSKTTQLTAKEFCHTDYHVLIYLGNEVVASSFYAVVFTRQNVWLCGYSAYHVGHALKGGK